MIFSSDFRTICWNVVVALGNITETLLKCHLLHDLNLLLNYTASRTGHTKRQNRVRSHSRMSPHGKTNCKKSVAKALVACEENGIQFHKVMPPLWAC